MNEYLTPYHPAVVHLPIALVAVSVLADIVFIFTGRQWANFFGRASLVAAAVGALLAAPLGYWDMKRVEGALSQGVHDHVHYHMYIGLTVTIAIIGLALIRWYQFSARDKAIGRAYLGASLLVLALTFYQGWLGGELVFTHGVAVQVTPGATPEAHSHQNKEN